MEYLTKGSIDDRKDDFTKRQVTDNKKCLILIKTLIIFTQSIE